MSRRLFALATFAMLAFVPLALADDDEDGDDDKSGKREREHSDARKLMLDVDDDKATIKLHREIGGVEDSVKIQFDADKAKVEVKHEEDDGANESEQKLEARFLALLEYVDANGDGAYQAGEAIASAWALAEEHRKDAKVPTNGTVDWGAISMSDVASGNVTGKKLSARASFGPNATFGLDFFVYGDFTLVGNSSLEPTEAKIDIIIQHYPYVSNGTALAVLVDLKAKEEFEHEGDDDEDEDGVSSESGAGNLTFRLTFTWLENATVDGVDRPVHSSVLKNKEEAEDGEISQKARVALSYPRGDLIVHDPTVGVSYQTASSDARAVPGPALALFIAAVALAAFGRRAW